MEIKLPVYVKSILNVLNECGYAAYVVGGCVRDSILGVEPKDWDITTDATSDQIESLFAQTIPTGKKYGTITVVWTSEDGLIEEHCEVTTFRADGNYSDGRRPDSVTFGKDIIEDLSRRDFTMNAMAYNELVGLVDPFNGCEHLEAGKLVAVGDAFDRFNEDALRILRAVRFSFKYSLWLSPDIVKGIKKAIDLKLLKNVSAERIHDEFIKILTYSNKRSKYIDNDIQILFNELFEVTHMNLKSILDSELPYTAKIYLLMSDIEYPLYQVEIWLRKYKFSKHDINRIIDLFKLDLFLMPRIEKDFTFKEFEYTTRLMMNKFSLDSINEYMLMENDEFIYKVELKANLNAPVHISDLKIDGNIIKEIFRKYKYEYTPIDVGVCLNCLMNTVLEDKTKNTSLILKNLVKEWIRDTDKKS
jgi:tRNA nucleotidyltransferase (CCA-adding enzyme)